MKRLLAGALMAGALLAGAGAPQAAPSHPASSLGDRISDAAMFDGRLWLLGASGALVTVDLANDSRQARFEQGVIDLQVRGDTLKALRSVEAGDLVVSTWTPQGFRDSVPLRLAEGDRPLALLAGAEGPVVLTSRTLETLSADGSTWRSTALKGTLRTGVHVSAAAPASGEAAYVGFNRGEWGGGLQRIDLRTGAVSEVQRRDGPEACSGPLNRECDPVTAVIPDPDRPDCVLASVGLVHMRSRGRIVQVCGGRVTVAFEQRAGDGASSEAVYGLAPARDGYWAATPRALYLFRRGRPTEYELPIPEPVAGVHLSEDVPGAVVVMTNLNAAVSLSDFTPLVAARDSSLTASATLR